MHTEILYVHLSEWYSLLYWLSSMIDLIYIAFLIHNSSGEFMKEAGLFEDQHCESSSGPHFFPGKSRRWMKT